LVGIAWSVMWFVLIFETPDEHPRITEHERNYIRAQMANQSNPHIKVCDLITDLYNGYESKNIKIF